MSQESVTAVELLSRLASTIHVIASNLQDNRLGRRTIQALLHDYASRAESDGHLINASRQDSKCAGLGLFLAYQHMELISWLARNNYTILSSSVKWYSLRKLFKNYRLPLLSISSQTADLKDQLENITKVAQLVHADLEANNVKSNFPAYSSPLSKFHKISIPSTAIKYRRVPIQEKHAGPPPEGM
jgi:hypothetical protein